MRSFFFRSEERSVDSLENSRENTPTKADAANMSDASDKSSSSRTDGTDTKHKGDSEQHKDTQEDIPSRRSRESNCPINTTESHMKSLETSETTRADRYVIFTRCEIQKIHLQIDLQECFLNAKHQMAD